MVKAMSFFVKGLYFPKPQMKMSTKVNFLLAVLFSFSALLWKLTTTSASTCFNFLYMLLFGGGGGHFFQWFFGTCIFFQLMLLDDICHVRIPRSSANWLIMQIEFVIHHSTWFKFYSRQVLLSSIISPPKIRNEFHKILGSIVWWCTYIVFQIGQVFWDTCGKAALPQL